MRKTHGNATRPAGYLVGWDEDQPFGQTLLNRCSQGLTSCSNRP